MRPEYGPSADRRSAARGLAAMNANRTHAIPRDFAVLAPTMTLTELIAHYGAGKSVVRRWLRETRCEPRRHERAPSLPEWFAERAHEASASFWAHQFGLTENWIRAMARRLGTRCKRQPTGWQQMAQQRKRQAIADLDARAFE